ncbi:unnamed protein product [Natator depressus]
MVILGQTNGPHSPVSCLLTVVKARCPRGNEQNSQRENERQKTIQQFFHAKASKTNQGEEHIKNQDYINMSSEGSSGVPTSDQPEAQIQLPTEETVSPKPKGSSRCLSIKVFPFIEVTKDGYWCTSCKKAYKDGKLPNAIIGKSGGAGLVRPINKANADKLREKAAKHLWSAST